MVALNVRQFENIQKYRSLNEKNVVGGHFKQYISRKEHAVAKVNKTLRTLLIVLIVITMTSYYFAVSSEVKLNKIRKEVIAISEENVDLQNKIDYLGSFYNVDKTVNSAKLLQTATEVLEVYLKPEDQIKQVQKNDRSV